MPTRKTLGGNIGSGGVMAAFGLQARSLREELGPFDSSERPAISRRADEGPLGDVATPSRSSADVRVATNLSAGVLALAKRAAYWNRETLRSFLERAIEAEAREVARDLGFEELPQAPALRKGRPLRT